ncbi:tRNA (N(6)-L-threonylcarbamoyladenosine(37)-C(2))-methylthiotransferase MtaB [Pseudoroseomonas wenyumeiae]|uniref:tRNA (N(6)-L-threonylcarbamoyladenosine(37)-C(2))-methylthiotransferase MtaB n=1 Tax=Teichococcus wenyumeiae TaxID=2478470 RepID=A0A3A9J322_9PROT|nr:tRNA (N(6)-L-threonylcarbamoyladenosine(37)-C(2))-methylthiotransferase MtaB [Pseudoroseomonas wenyumeiae]RKK01597.1 tRNA (N(6)-L-threonylcarbamoyladenosine(37)-C(2))-methylthiotransferase MtaB [Pseudoroseomonas wenyumeiae]RMI26667.1 tRNA (N(6)-L-threonylcarbamoyladenosine(37)-C(2))-methylthiotransferase MtaB [Pseudoroseomonas wenyumeiae]
MSVEVLSFGCRLNTYESEAMRGLATRAGHAGTVLVNTCAVTAEAEKQAAQAIRRIARERPGVPIVVTGCAAQIAPARWGALPGVARVIGNADKLKPEAWAPDAPAAPVSDIMAARDVAAHPVTEFTGRARALIEVQQGCDHRCTFCVIPFGRGPSRSAPMGAVVQQVRAAVAAGYQEVVLTGVDIASYGPDLPGAPTLGQMIRRLLALVPELPRLRLSSIDPAAIDDDLWRLIGEEPRLMPHLHLSLQHGADLMLKRMKRRHSRADALAVAARARALRPGLALGADLIAGFPTETEEQFAEMLALVEEAGLHFLHVFPYSERPGTPAARMPQLPVALRRDRAARLRAAGAAATQRFFAARMGQEEAVLLERPDAGHTEHFCSIRLTHGSGQRGRVLRARVTGADARGLLAEAA